MRINDNAFHSKYSPIPWWLHLGKSIYGDVLFVGEITQTEESFIKQLSQSLHCLSNVQQLNVNTKYSSIIINNVDSIITDSEITALVQRCCQQQVSIVIYEYDEFYIKNIFKRPRLVFLNLFKNVRRKQLSDKLVDFHIDEYQSISYDGIIHESISEGDYYSNKNNFLTKEKIKNLIFNSRFARAFTNSRVWILNRQFSETLVSLTRNSVNKCLSDEPQVNLALSTIQYKYGKLIISFINQSSGKIYYVFFAFSDDAVVQRENEVDCLLYLRQFPELLPYCGTPVNKMIINGYHAYLIEETKGFTIDASHQYLDEMTRSVFDVLIKLARATINSNNAQSGLEGWTDNLFRNFKLRAPEHLNEIERLQNFIDAKIKLQKFPVVCAHGDAKLENFILNAQHQVIGIIDWELCQLNSVPLLDLTYLLIYNREVTRAELFGEAFIKVLVEDLEPSELALIREYCRIFNIDNAAKLVLNVFVFVHHYGARFHLDINESDSYASFQYAMRKLLKAISVPSEIS